jgi:hypothetical protein
MTQKEGEVFKQIWYNELTTKHQPYKETSHEYYNTKSKLSSSGSKICDKKRKK